MSDHLSFEDLRQANFKRQVDWENDKDIFSLEYLGCAMAGEVGEACNVIKKLVRERRGAAGSRTTYERLAEELADVIIYADLIAKREGINLGEAVREKFNSTSKKYGFGVFL